MGRRMKHTDIGDIPADWKLQTFEETFRVLPNNTLSRENLNNKGGAVRNIHYGDILTKFPEVLKCNEEDIPYLNDLSLITANTQLLQDGDVVIADTAEDDTVGKTIEVQNLGNGKLVAGLHTIPCRVKKGDFAPGWLGYYMNSNIYHDQIIPFITGIKVSSISKGAIAETIILIPPVEEQKRIIETLFQIDKLITQEKIVLGKIIDFKAGCLSKMFPKNDKKQPEMRYLEFSDDWEQRKFSELTEIRSASRVHKEEWKSSGVPFYRSSDVMAALNGTENEKAFISEELYEKLTAVSGKLEKGDVLVTGGGSVGKPYIVANNEPLYTKDADLLWIKNNEYLDPYFVYTFFFSQTFTDYLNSVSHVGTIAHYTITQLGETPITLPCVSEQQKIGDYFRNLDSLITLHQRKCDKYTSIQSGLISKLISMK